MKTTVRVTHSTSHITTVSVTVTEHGVTSAWSEKCSSTGIAAAVTRVKGKALDNLSTVLTALGEE